MNIVMWILQIALAALYISGGAYKVSNADALLKYIHGFPRGAWRTLGAIEVLGGVLLVVPVAVTGSPLLIPVAAAVLTAETLFLVALYARRSVKLVVANPLVWAAPMALVAAIVAYGRYALA